MNPDSDRLYTLLPGVYRRRDLEQGEPLRALLAIIAEQVNIVQADVEQLYDDWFIETCQDWVVPYLGDLVGYQLLHGFDEALATGTDEAKRLLATIAPRRDVAHTVANRRRKGTLALLEQLAADVADWPARAVEFRRLLGITQPVRLYGTDQRADAPRRHRGRLADLRHVDALDRLDGPFDELAHTVAVPRINSARRQERYNIPDVGLFVWRLRPYPITEGPAYCDDRDRRHFTFSVLGNDAPLVTRPVLEPSPTHIADQTNVPAYIRRKALVGQLAHYYGPGKSLRIWLGGDTPAAPRTPVPLASIVPADLSDWTYRPRAGQVAVDPVLGRIAFPARSPDTGVWVTYHYAFSADLGGGEYLRPLEPAQPPALYRADPGDGTRSPIMEAVGRWQTDKANDSRRKEAAIELTGGEYREQIEIRLDVGDRLTLRAAQGTRPVLRLLDYYSNRPDAMRMTGTGAGGKDDPPSRIVLDGLLVTGRGIRVSGPVGQVVVRHCTLVPGWALDARCQPVYESEASVELDQTPACLQVEHSIIGTILVGNGDPRTEPSAIFVSDGIVDATMASLPALTGPESRHAPAVLNARRVTVIGGIRVHAVGLVEDSILDGDVRVARRQSGCIRFCWLPTGSSTPQRFHCQPELSGEPARVIPRFTSTRYGTPGYAQLALSCATEISRGADDGSEMGAFHDLFQPQRTDNLQLRLDEYTPAGCDAGLIFVT
jgi:hypothetical protein